MGLIRRAEADNVAAGEAGPDDMATVIHRAVESEIERQRLARLETDAPRDTDAGADRR